MNSSSRVVILCLTIAVLVAPGCHRKATVESNPMPPSRASKPRTNAPGLPAIDPWKMVLLPHEGSNSIDRLIQSVQTDLRAKRTTPGLIEKLGWLFVSKTRSSFDPGFLKLAEQCAVCLEQGQPDAPETLLLRGHVLHQLHQFHGAEKIARQLVSKRGISPDLGLLGDVLMDLGMVDEAVAVYQRMMDMKPDPQAHLRAAHARWLSGDLEGAIEVARVAAGAASPTDAESAAWSYTRLALYLWQAGDGAGAAAVGMQALQFSPDYPPTLLCRGRMLLASGRTSEAIPDLQLAAAKNPLPEYYWALAEALHEAGRSEEARTIEGRLVARGIAEDPRTLSLYLATRRERTDLALHLAERELDARQDIFTHDAHAWALAANGRWTEAQEAMQRALARHTIDARLFFHATVIALRSGNVESARRHLEQSKPLQNLLLPAERTQLRAVAAEIELVSAR